MDEQAHAELALRRVEAAVTATAHFAPSDSRLIEDAANAVARELVASGWMPDAVRQLAAQVTCSGIAVERADLAERLRRTIERTLAACEQERWTSVQPLRAVSEHGDAVPSTAREFRTIGEFRDTRTFRTTGEHQGTDVARVAP